MTDLPRTARKRAAVRRDWTSLDGANAIADRVRSYWKARGFRGIECRVESDGLRGYAVRTNLVNGVPPRGYSGGGAPRAFV